MAAGPWPVTASLVECWVAPLGWRRLGWRILAGVAPRRCDSACSQITVFAHGEPACDPSAAAWVGVTTATSPADNEHK